MFPYMQPPFNPREWIEAMQDYDEWQEEREKRRKDKDKDKNKPGDKRKGFSGMEIFLILTLLSPVAGPLYLYAVIAAARHIGEMLQQVH